MYTSPSRIVCMPSLSCTLAHPRVHRKKPHVPGTVINRPLWRRVFTKSVSATFSKGSFCVFILRS